MEKELASVNPSLYSHKGTPVRYYLEFSDNSNALIEPLRTRSGGIVFNNALANKILNINGLLDNTISLIGNDESVTKSIDFPDGVHLTRIEATVIYPDGSTWEGQIAKGCERCIGMLIWSWDLAHRVHAPDKRSHFGFSLPWNEVPTTVAFFIDDTTVVECGHQHACPKMCSDITKRI